MFISRQLGLRVNDVAKVIDNFPWDPRRHDISSSPAGITSKINGLNSKDSNFHSSLSVGVKTISSTLNDLALLARRVIYLCLWSRLLTMRWLEQTPSVPLCERWKDARADVHYLVSFTLFPNTPSTLPGALVWSSMQVRLRSLLLSCLVRPTDHGHRPDAVNDDSKGACSTTPSGTTWTSKASCCPVRLRR